MKESESWKTAWSSAPWFFNGLSKAYSHEIDIRQMKEKTNMDTTHFDWTKLKNIQKAHRMLYAIGLGPLIGWIILLLTTTGRRSGLKRITPVQYELIGSDYYIGAARGLKADWVRNIQNNPQVEVRVGARHFRGTAGVVTDPSRLADFLEVRLERHPRLMSVLLKKTHGLSMPPSRGQLEELAKTEALVIVHPSSG